MIANSGKDVIRLENVWKVFGARAAEALSAIKADNLSKAEVLSRYNCVVGVADASIAIREGEIFCIMGLSGSGKSTLVRHINRLLEPTAGRIDVSGVDVMSLDAKALRALRSQKIGMVFQNFGLMPHRTVRDNVALPLEVRAVGKTERWRRAERAISLVELDGWADKYAHELSGGMQQRVGLARALAADPDILLMDEPFSALDPLIRRQLQNQFMELSAKMKKTTVFITHDLDEAIRIGHRIAIMKEGQIVQIGTPEEIVTQPADDYVAEFVAGISRLKLVFAHSIMQPIADFEVAGGVIPADAPRTGEETDLDHLIDLNIAAKGGPVLIEDAEGRPIGIVTGPDLLHGIQGQK